jgi:hypothetical protein
MRNRPKVDTKNSPNLCNLSTIFAQTFNLCTSAYFLPTSAIDFGLRKIKLEKGFYSAFGICFGNNSSFSKG